jgi:hypothetical protein
MTLLTYLTTQVAPALIATLLTTADHLAPLVPLLFSPKWKQKMIAGDFVRTYAPKYFGKVPDDMGRREISLTIAAGTALIFASFAGIPYLSSWLVVPTGFANYYAFRCVLDHVAPPV